MGFSNSTLLACEIVTHNNLYARHRTGSPRKDRLAGRDPFLSQFVYLTFRLWIHLALRICPLGENLYRFPKGKRSFRPRNLQHCGSYRSRTGFQFAISPGHRPDRLGRSCLSLFCFPGLSSFRQLFLGLCGRARGVTHDRFPSLIAFHNGPRVLSLVKCERLLRSWREASRCGGAVVWAAEPG